MTLSLELELLARCCRWSFPGGDRAAPITDGAVDWQLFVRLARFHRVQGLAWRALNATGLLPPRAAGEALSNGAASVAAANLQAAAECKRLHVAFEQARLPLLFLKGLTLGSLAYGDGSIKSAIDIDLLIAPDDLDDAAELLGRMDYRLAAPRGVSGAGLRRWHQVRKESSWRKAGSDIPVDLHTRVADNPRLLAGVDVNSPRQQVDIGNGIVLPTLATDLLFAYLAVHGASSAWFRLKWISDFAALVSQLTPAEAVRLLHRSNELGAGRAAGQALLLADSLFGTLDALPGMRDELTRDAAVRRLHRAALKQLASPAEPVEPTAMRLGTLTIHWTQFLLQPGAAYKASELVRQLHSTLP